MLVFVAGKISKICLPFHLKFASVILYLHPFPYTCLQPLPFQNFVYSPFSLSTAEMLLMSLL